ncbi:uncharacterized protein LOC127881678 [Dreissena polymorpha]|uniref:EF-hand domain-containing protein n=1 Tax=Dreissena polymorpha TaxID=45954 RepID=A0A9D4JR28_DREPO|nr:uncharacterized protein LOC127881678 [Dreissena polymorpha]KAH3819694.1 hypothetical protein DPMN_121437 [Dreissena polymorpha]
MNKTVGEPTKNVHEMTQVKNETTIDPFLESKIRVWYRANNKKRNGNMAKTDFKEMAECFIRAFELGPDDARTVRSWLVDGWATMIEYMDTMAQRQDDTRKSDTRSRMDPRDQIPTAIQMARYIAEEKTITEEMYVQAFREVLVLNPSPFLVYFTHMVEDFFDIFDDDGDNSITEEGMVKGLGCFGFANADSVRNVFKGLDVNGSGRVDRKTYVAAWVEFFQGTNRDTVMAKHFTLDMFPFKH